MPVRPTMSPWRPLAYYAIAVFGGAVYGGQVCPLMDELTVLTLGLIILFPLALAYALRGYLLRRLVQPVEPILQSHRQFLLEMSLFAASGLVSALMLRALYGFPVIESGMKLVLGLFTVGVFAGLDMALARERLVIERALTGDASYKPPATMIPLTRKLSVTAVLVLLLITGIILLVVIRDVGWLATQDLNPTTIGMLRRSVLIEILFVMGFLLAMVVNLVLSYARNLRILFDNQTGVLENVTRGDLSRRVPVTTTDELGVIAGHTNAMIGTLREGMRMREGLLIAQEVQQHFLPKSAPRMDGLDIAGLGLFSDETGGDFYDFIACEAESCGQLAVAVGDVTGHGIGAALLMTAGRAVIRQNAATPGSVTENIRRANMHLTRDIGDTGRFMTLFFLVIDPVGRRLTWVNAGHQPPQFFDPATDRFTELKGVDIPLGVEPDWAYHEQTMDQPGPGQILLVCTDGLWEARDARGEMFGKRRIRQVIRENRERPAEAIVEALCDAVLAFSGRTRQEDDLTVVVIKGVAG